MEIGKRDAMTFPDSFANTEKAWSTDGKLYHIALPALDIDSRQHIDSTDLDIPLDDEPSRYIPQSHLADTCAIAAFDTAWRILQLTMPALLLMPFLAGLPNHIAQ